MIDGREIMLWHDWVSATVYVINTHGEITPVDTVDEVDLTW
jgi:hypothetical protein